MADDFVAHAGDSVRKNKDDMSGIRENKPPFIRNYFGQEIPKVVRTGGVTGTLPPLPRHPAAVTAVPAVAAPAEVVEQEMETCGYSSTPLIKVPSPAVLSSHTTEVAIPTIEVTSPIVDAVPSRGASFVFPVSSDCTSHSQRISQVGTRRPKG